MSRSFERLAQLAYLDAILVPALEPIVDLRTGEVSHYEMLARVNERSPWAAHNILVASAEEHGYIDRLDLTMLDIALRIIGGNQEISLSLNVSPLTIELSAEEYCSRLLSVGAACQQLVVEITEVRPVSDFDVARRFIDGVRNAGARIALDDFGATQGFFDHAAVRSLVPEFLKLDGSLVAAGLDGKREFREALDIAAELGCEVVGEWVDSAAKLRLLVDAGVGYAQGSLFGKAVFYPHWRELMTVFGSSRIGGVVLADDNAVRR